MGHLQYPSMMLTPDLNWQSFKFNPTDLRPFSLSTFISSLVALISALITFQLKNRFNSFLPDAASTLHYPFLTDVASLRSPLLKTITVLTVCMDNICLSHDKTKFLDRKFPEFWVLVNQTLLQMVPVFSCNFSCFAAHSHCQCNNSAWNRKNNEEKWVKVSDKKWLKQ